MMTIKNWELKMNRRNFLFGIMRSGIFMALAQGTQAFAADVAAAQALVTNIANDVMKLANSGQTGKPLRASFSKLVGHYVDLRKVADFALGQYRKNIPAGREAEFYQLVNNYAAGLFVYYVADFKGVGLKIVNVTQQGNFTVIQSSIDRGGLGGEQIRWRLAPQGKDYAIVDVNIKGVWLTISMKKRFTDILRKSGGDFAPLIADLRQAETW